MRHKPVWHTVTIAHVHMTVRAGQARDVSFTLTRQGASWLMSKRMLTLTVTTRATATGAKAARLVNPPPEGRHSQAVARQAVVR